MNNDNQGIEVKLLSPFLAILLTLIEQGETKATINKQIEQFRESEEEWTSFIDSVREKASELLMLSIETKEESSGVIGGLLHLAAASTLGLNRIPFFITEDYAYFSKETMNVLDEISKKEDAPSTETLFKTLKKEEFIEFADRVLKEDSPFILPLATDVSILVGEYSKDTWLLLEHTIGHIFTPSLFLKEMSIDTKVFGILPLYALQSHAIIELARNASSLLKDNDLVREELNLIWKWMEKKNEEHKELHGNEDG